MTIEVNKAGYEQAKQLIEQGRVVVDDRSDWDQVNPGADQQDQLIRNEGMEGYARWHLGIKKGGSREDKSTYSSPYGDHKKVYRSALIAAEERAAQYHHGAVEQAAKNLLGMLPEN